MFRPWFPRVRGRKALGSAALGSAVLLSAIVLLVAPTEARAAGCTDVQFQAEASGSACVCPNTEYRIAYDGGGGGHCTDVSVTLYTVNTFSLTKRASTGGGSSQNSRSGHTTGSKTNPIKSTDKVAVKVECKDGECAGKSKWVVGAGSGGSVPGVPVTQLGQCAAQHPGCAP
jgi:hypothetical protein